MADPLPGESITALIAAADRGDASARSALFAALYDDLHRLAEGHIRRQRGNVSLGITTLVHEAYIHIAHRDGLVIQDRNRFFGYASRAMRGLVIDYIRERGAAKRGGALTFTTLEDDEVPMVERPSDLEALSRALDELSAIEPGLVELVDLKFFCGFSVAEIAAIRNVSERTVGRDWAAARLLLRRAMG